MKDHVFLFWLCRAKVTNLNLRTGGYENGFGKDENGYRLHKNGVGGPNGGYKLKTAPQKNTGRCFGKKKSLMKTVLTIVFHNGEGEVELQSASGPVHHMYGASVEGDGVFDDGQSQPRAALCTAAA